jgi:hypothetical protein
MTINPLLKRMSDFYPTLPSGDLLLCAKHLFAAARTVWHRRQSSRGERDRVGCSATQCSLTGHLNRGIDGVFEIVRLSVAVEPAFQLVPLAREQHHT